MLAPVSASISTPVLWCTLTVQRITAASPSMPMVIWQFSMPSGWQKGMSSWVRLAPMTPATMAVSNIGPFGDRKPPPRSTSATAAGNRTRLSATAVRCEALLAPTSTMVGRSPASMWVNVMAFSRRCNTFRFSSRRARGGAARRAARCSGRCAAPRSRAAGRAVLRRSRRCAMARADPGRRARTGR